MQPGTAAQPVIMPPPRLPRPMTATRTVGWAAKGTPIIDFWPGLRRGACSVAATGAADPMPVARAPVAAAEPRSSRRETAGVSGMTATLLVAVRITVGARSGNVGLSNTFGA
ncbi:hypothetical protein GCM10010348_04520 [Streptomyces anthocyanicus]|nr:hypothetical protein GCM10010348_04520 [Streptomyces anthocyanicus]